MARKHRIRVDGQGRALIPKPLREEMGLSEPGEAIAWIEEGRLVVEPRASLLERVRARYRGGAEAPVEALEAERREEVESEEGSS